MSGHERRTPSVTWGARRAQTFSGNIKSFSKLVSGLCIRVATVSQNHEAQPPEAKAPESEETIDVLKLEHEALLVAEEELRAQLEELESGHLLMQAERRRFDHVFDGAPDGYLITDGFGTIQELNPAMAKLLGGPPRSFVRKPVPLYVDEPHRRGVRDFLSTFSEGSSAELQLVVVAQDGLETACSVAISRMPRLSTHAGHTLFWRFRRLTSGEEATRAATAATMASASGSEDALAELERRWSRERDARERLEGESRAKDRLIAMVSHDLRAPLHSMLSWAQLLRKNGADEQLRKQALAAIIRGGRTQSALLEDLLDVSRIAEGKLAVEMLPLNLTYVVQSAVEALSESAHEAEVTLTSQLVEHVTITGDSTRMHQVVTNLVANAIKFTPRGGSIHVALDRDGDALLRVRDTGKGIARDALFEIFDCYAQASRTDARDGIGLGLYITRHLVERHGGTIRADSEGPGAGAVFTVRLPIHEVPIAEPSSILLPDAAMGPLELALLTDDRDVRDLVVADLRRASVEVAISCVSLEAFAACAELDADIVVVDVPADVGRCAQIVRTLRATRDVPIIAISAFATAVEVRAILDAGFDVHLSKPFSAEELTATIRAALPRAFDRKA